MLIMQAMQSPPYQQWNTPSPSRRNKGPNVLLIVFGVLGSVGAVCCGGGSLFLWRSGVGDTVACSNYMASGEYKKAIPACRSVVEKMPAVSAAHNNLAWCLALDGQGPEAVQEAKKAVEIAPRPTYYDTLAMALAISGRGKEALDIETTYVMVNGEVANDAQKVTLGMVYYSVGRTQDARAQWEQVKKGTDETSQKLAQSFETKYR